MGKVRAEKSSSRALWQAEGEGAALLEGVLEGVGLVGPEEPVAGEGILKRLVRGEGERGNGDGTAREREGEAWRSRH